MPACIVLFKGATTRFLEVARSARVAEVMLDFMKIYPGVVVVLQKVGARARSPELRAMRVVCAGRLRVTRDAHDCAQAALLNGLDALREQEEDKAVAVNIGATVLVAEGQRGLVF